MLYYIEYMKYKFITIILILVLSGCVGGQSGAPVGGVFKSTDSGRTFEPKNTID